MREAVSHDPSSWETYYALAIAQASAGVDPRANVERALHMNPLEPLTREAAKELRGSSPTEWVVRAAVVRATALESNDLSIFPPELRSGHSFAQLVERPVDATLDRGERLAGELGDLGTVSSAP